MSAARSGFARGIPRDLFQAEAVGRLRYRQCRFARPTWAEGSCWSDLELRTLLASCTQVLYEFWRQDDILFLETAILIDE